MSSKKYVWLTIRGVFILALAGMTALHGRQWLFNMVGLQVSEGGYLVIVAFVLVLSSWLATKDILRDLQANFEEKRKAELERLQESAAYQPKNSSYEFRNRALQTYLFSSLGFVFLIAPFFSTTGKPLTLLGFMLSWTIAFAIFAYSIYELRYRVYIDGENVKVKAWKERRFSLKDVSRVEIVMLARVGAVARVTFKYGDVLDFSEDLNDFPLLVSLLRTGTGS
jgi:hypothetical protein